METQRIWGTLDPFYEAGPILGRKVANIGFISALFNLDPFDEYHFFLSGSGARNGLKEFLNRNFPALLNPGKIKIMDRRELPSAISSQEYFCFHQSDCILYPPHLARIRNMLAKNIFPITGTTHSLSYSNYGSSFLNYLWKGTTDRDCIVGTSSLGTKVVENYLKQLREGYGLNEQDYPSPQLKTIPLGINPEPLSPPEEEQKKQASQQLGFAEDERVNILVFGRIAHYSKMDLLPLLRAMQRLFASGMKRDKVRLILAGWLDDEDDFPETMAQLAKNMGLELVIVARPSETVKLDLYRAADIFVSISDNPQETFGLTVLEAGAMGLPVIASEYDGYRDLVVDGKTGFLIETIGPAETQDLDPMAPLCFDNQYHLMMAQQTAVLTPALAQSLEKLINNKALRQEMGQAAVERIQKQFTWKQVVLQYVKLWEELNTVPVKTETLRKAKHPIQVRYGEAFGHYTSSTITPKTMVATGVTGQAIYHGREFPLIYRGIERSLQQEVIKKMAFFARKPISVRDLTGKIRKLAPTLSDSEARFHILWCIKHDILEKL